MIYKVQFLKDLGIDMETKLSITIVAYHNYDDIKKAIKTIEEYTSKEIKKHIYIVDNSCYENDNKMVIEFKNIVLEYDDVEYINVGSNLGFGKGNNYILKKLNSEYHAIVNPDIFLIEDAFSSIIDYLNQNKDIGMCIPRLIDENGQLQLAYRKEITIFDMFIRMFCKKLFPKRIAKHTLQDRDFSKSFQVPFAQGSFLVIRTELFKKLEGFDDGYFMYLEDADLCKRVNNISKLMYYPEVSVIHKWERGSHKNKQLFKYHVDSMRYYFKKWGYKWF